MNFGEFLSSKRKEKNITQKELAEKLYVSESAVCKWEKNIARPDIYLLPELAKILSVTEHELITADVDEERHKTDSQAKKWRNLTSTYNLFFFISYTLAILTCFIVNLATGGKLDWFFIVLTSVLLAGTFTTLPQYVKKYRL
ncbi:MAG: helix-turn-helix domain-containing protein, partial [Clostridia bacterium]|nr:helix-turn-helix domain-containing protein [Clostridia bacterium]